MTSLSVREKELELFREGAPFRKVTLIALRGHAPQTIGATLLMESNGNFHGTIGGGKLEAKCLNRLRSTEADAAPYEVITWNLQRDVGMTCGGEVTLLFENHSGTEMGVVIFGAGHVAQAVVRTLLPLQAQIQVFDTRSEWIERLPTAPLVKGQVVADLPGLVSTLVNQSYVLIMTQGHATDYPVVQACLRRGGFKYVGMLGSPIKAQKVRRDLLEAGFSRESVDFLDSPMGLRLGNNRPEEIAISIVAKLLQLKSERAN